MTGTPRSLTATRERLAMRTPAEHHGMADSDRRREAHGSRSDDEQSPLREARTLILRAAATTTTAIAALRHQNCEADRDIAATLAYGCDSPLCDAIDRLNEVLEIKDDDAAEDAL
jgi:hypothetical protein